MIDLIIFKILILSVLFSQFKDRTIKECLYNGSFETSRDNNSLKVFTGGLNARLEKQMHENPWQISIG